MAVATGIIIVAGSITFANEWYQTRQVNWRVPVATILIAAVFDGLAKLDDKAATFTSIMVLLGASTVQFNGRSAVQTVTDIFNQPKSVPKNTRKG